MKKYEYTRSIGFQLMGSEISQKFLPMEPLEQIKNSDDVASYNISKLGYKNTKDILD